MASYNFDFDCPLFFEGTNYFFVARDNKRYIKYKDLNLWEIIVEGLIVIKKAKDECTEHDYKKIFKNFKTLNILYYALTT